MSKNFNPERLLQVLVAPQISEKATYIADKNEQVVFIVTPDATKPEVKAAVLDAIRRIRKAGKPAGVLSLDQEFVRECMVAGTVFTAIDVDSAILIRTAKQVLDGFRAL